MPHLQQLTPEQGVGVFTLIKVVTEFDQVQPLSDHILLHLRHGGDKEDSHLVIYEDENPNKKVIGYAHIDQTDLVAGASVELVIDPAARGGSLGEQLLTQVRQICGDKLRLWSHGDLPDAHKLALSQGFKVVRTVIQMIINIDEHIPLPKLDPDISIRTFLPGLDSNSWITLNNKAFIDHPEQGNWQLSDLNLRLKEEWFNESGFFIASKSTQMIGATWTKIHGSYGHTHEGNEAAHDHPVIGELYITAVDPEFTGLGVGKALTITALNYLRYQGLTQVILYVDESNKTAIKLYENLGFNQFSRDILFKL